MIKIILNARKKFTFSGEAFI